MEFIRGDRIDDIEKLKQLYGEPLNASRILIEVFGKMIFIHGFVHCDAHPGNIIVRPNPKNPK